jgi:hypothetical protein
MLAPLAWPPEKRVRDALAGAAAGVCNVLALHPLDVVKTRLQGARAAAKGVCAACAHEAALR